MAAPFVRVVDWLVSIRILPPAPVPCVSVKMLLPGPSIRTDWAGLAVPCIVTLPALPVPELFVSDSLHMTSKGYDIWQEALKPVLKK